MNERIEAMRQRVKTGVSVPVAPTLYPTPPTLADEAVELSEITIDCSVLEPEAGTANIIRAIGNRAEHIVAVEICAGLIPGLKHALESLGYPPFVFNQDFLTMTPDNWIDGVGLFDRVIMNPPFNKGQDIAHIQHALKFVKPGGNLVAICADGPRQHKKLEPLTCYWKPLKFAFKAAGTNVNTALIKIEV